MLCLENRWQMRTHTHSHRRFCTEMSRLSTHRARCILLGIGAADCNSFCCDSDSDVGCCNCILCHIDEAKNLPFYLRLHGALIDLLCGQFKLHFEVEQIRLLVLQQQQQHILRLYVWRPQLLVYLQNID